MQQNIPAAIDKHILPCDSLTSSQPGLAVRPCSPLPPPPPPPPPAVHSRTLLFTETDEFGNIIDPETGRIVSEHGGLSPTPPYPWSLQTPAFLAAFSASLSRTLSSHVTHKADFSHTPSFDSRQDL